MEIRDLIIALLVWQNGVVQTEDVQEKVGQSFSIFHRFGFLNLGMKVVPDNEMEIISEPTKPVFNETFVSTEELPGAYEDEFHVHFCSSVNELFAAYFEHFSITGVHNAWKAFFTFPSLHLSSYRYHRFALRYLGIRSFHITGDYRYAFVRLYRRDKKYGLLNDTSTINPVYQHLFQTIQTQNDYFNLLDQVGSHYIDALEIGDFVYQVFVFDNLTYSYILNDLKTTYVITNDTEGFDQAYFNNWYVTYFGRLQSGSGHWALNSVLESDDFKIPKFIFGSYYSIFRLRDQKLRQKIERYNTGIITSMNLKPISDVLQDEQRKPFESWLLNRVQLWENNM